MSLTQPSLTAPPHRNQRLFSDHYLDRLLPGTPDWMHDAEGAAAVLRKVRAIYAAFTPTTNEAQTEERLVRPVHRALRHTFEVQPSLKTPDGTRRPDYDLDPHTAHAKASQGFGPSDYPLAARARFG